MRSASCGGGDRALDQRQVVGPWHHRRASPRGNRRSRPRRRRPAARPRSRAGVSWQPSQEANFQTASLGLRPARHRQISRMLKRRREPVVGEHRPVLADEGRAELAVAAEADGAFHVALHREVDRARPARPPSCKRGDREAHHDLRAADQGDGVRRIEGGARDQRRHHADVAAPVGAGVVDGDLDVDVEPPPPALELAAEEDVVRRCARRRGARRGRSARARRAGGRAPGGAARGRARRRRSTTSRAAASATGQPRAERAAQAERVAGLQPRQRLGHRADGADRVDQPLAARPGRR